MKNFKLESQGTKWRSSQRCQHNLANVIIKCCCTYIYIYVYTWNPHGAPCFDWSLDLVLEGPRLKIEDKQVPGIYIYRIYIYETGTREMVQTPPMGTMYHWVHKLAIMYAMEFWLASKIILFWNPLKLKGVADVLYV